MVLNTEERIEKRPDPTLFPSLYPFTMLEQLVVFSTSELHSNIHEIQEREMKVLMSALFRARTLENVIDIISKERLLLTINAISPAFTEEQAVSLSEVTNFVVRLITTLCSQTPKIRNEVTRLLTKSSQEQFPQGAVDLYCRSIISGELNSTLYAKYFPAIESANPGEQFEEREQNQKIEHFIATAHEMCLLALRKYLGVN